MFEKRKARLAEKKAEQERQRAAELARIENEKRAERERLLSLSEKELLVELIMELKTSRQYFDLRCDEIIDSCEDVRRAVIVWSSN